MMEIVQALETNLKIDVDGSLCFYPRLEMIDEDGTEIWTFRAALSEDK